MTARRLSNMAWEELERECCPPARARHPRRSRRDPGLNGIATRSGALPAAPYLVVERTTRIVARDGLFSFEGRRYAVPDAKPGERVELLLGAQKPEAYRV